MRRWGFYAAIIGGSLLAAGAACAAEGTPTPDAISFFETRVRPVLVERCQSCHGPKQQRGDLRLDSAPALRKGGTRGAAIVPGAPRESLLIRAVAHLGDAPKMPPDKKLSDRQIADLTRWVQMGAAWPLERMRDEGGGLKGRKDPAYPSRRHWAFQAVRQPAPPPVKNRAWVRSPIDAFILAKLEEKGLKPAPPADRRTLIRRATFDLIGLPPTPAEVDAFIADRSPDAYEKLVERLLISPRYGERWGRRWLDVARYADSNGLDENLAYANAFRYRDYVIEAFNRDKPFDRFLVEQIAGDLLPATGDEAADRERVVATGFLSLGAKMLAEDDPVKMEMDIVDEQVDTVGRAFMGLTLGCARCHDHKFDPISAADYYGLAGIFKSTHTMENFKVVAVWNENVLAKKEEQERLAEQERAIKEKKERARSLGEKATEQLLTEARRKAGTYLLAGTALLRQEGTLPPDGLARLAAEHGLIPDLLQQWSVFLKDSRAEPNSVLQEWHRAAGTSRVAADTSSPASLFGGTKPASLEELASAYQALFDAVDAEPNAGKGLAARVPAGAYNGLRFILRDPQGPFAAPVMPERYFSTAASAELKGLADELKSLEQSLPALPRALGVREGKATNLRIHLRGDHLTLGDEIPRRFPAAFSGAVGKPIDDRQSGRLQLAEWLASPDNPLTSRVIANRVWLGHFGEGIVRSPDNFGTLGERPTHPALLDWLAVRLVKDRWSLKSLHRTVMLSNTYRMSTVYDPRAAQIDPENRLLWRRNRIRLEAEAIRDSILAVSGQLDLGVGGSLLTFKNREYVTSTANRDTTSYDSPRRAVYLPVIRSALYDVFQAFDFGDPSVINGQRGTTTVAPQALFMMNGAVVLKETRRMAAALLADRALDDPGRVGLAYRRMFGRAPTPVESARALQFVRRIETTLAESVPDQAERAVRAWQSLCRVLIASNEFIYVE